jgi:rod shape-determining protein MreC
LKLKHYLSKYGVRVAVVAVILALIVGAVSSLLHGRAGALKNADGALKAPLEKAATALLDWMEDIYGYIYDYDRISEENNALRAENAELREAARDYDEVTAENERLRALFDWAQRHTDFTMESAKIIAWDTSNYTSAFTISKGSASGIELGDCVVTEYGALVGQITELGSEWATVRSVIDVDMDVGALVGTDRFAGMITGEFSLMKQGLTRVTYLASGAQIFPGDEVLTSGKGGYFPAGLLIGTVSSVLSESGGQVTFGIVTPSCDLGRLSQVFIIKDFTIVE